MKKAIIWTCVALIAAGIPGCKAITKSDIMQAAERHDAALVSADRRIAAADGKLATIKNPPAQVGEARADLKGARADVKVAQTEAGKLRSLAIKQTEAKEKITTSWSYRIGQLAVGLGVTLALVGLLIVVLRFGGWGGALASIPILGLLLARLGVKPKVGGLK